MADALYGPDGFFLRSRPAEHFRTSVASPLFAPAVRRLAGLVDDALGQPDPFDLVDLGAGRGELLSALADVPDRWRLTGVDLAPAGADRGRAGADRGRAGMDRGRTGVDRDSPRPPYAWRSAVPPLTGLLIANEWLDNVPLDVVSGGRLVLVSPGGVEAPGARSPYAAWCARWWPGAERAEVGLSRDLAWSAAVAQVQRGLAVAIDYGHVIQTRRPTLTGYRHGRQMPPVPDGSCDLTAHVALDSCAAVTRSRLVRQRDALEMLGISAKLPTWDGAAGQYAQALAASSQGLELLDPHGLGGFGWLVRAVGIDDPLAACPPW